MGSERMSYFLSEAALDMAALLRPTIELKANL